MEYAMQAAGIIILLSVIWLRAVRKMTTDLTAFWGILGIVLAALSTVISRFGRIAALEAGHKRVLILLGIMILTGGFIASLYFSSKIMKDQELAIRRSLSLQEKEQISGRLDEMNEKNSLCN